VPHQITLPSGWTGQLDLTAQKVHAGPTVATKSQPAMPSAVSLTRASAHPGSSSADNGVCSWTVVPTPAALPTCSRAAPAEAMPWSAKAPFSTAT
jgi:hypothetical protein